MICYATSAESNQRHFLPIPNVRRKFRWAVSLLCGYSHVDAFPNATTLSSSSRQSIIIYPLYLHNLHFLQPLPSFIPLLIHYNHFSSNSLPWVLLKLFIRWNIKYKIRNKTLSFSFFLSLFVWSTLGDHGATSLPWVSFTCKWHPSSTFLFWWS